MGKSILPVFLMSLPLNPNMPILPPSLPLYLPLSFLPSLFILSSFLFMGNLSSLSSSCPSLLTPICPSSLPPSLFTSLPLSFPPS
jgi:hypothetical protein